MSGLVRAVDLASLGRDLRSEIAALEDRCVHRISEALADAKAYVDWREDDREAERSRRRAAADVVPADVVSGLRAVLSRLERAMIALERRVDAIERD